MAWLIGITCQVCGRSRFRISFDLCLQRCNLRSKVDAAMPRVPEKQLSPDDVDSVVEAAGSSKAASVTPLETARQPHDTLAEIESLEQLLHEADSGASPAADIPEHPAVKMVSGELRVATPPCIACHATVAQRRYAIEGVSEEFIECENCGLGSLFPMPNAQRIQSFYPAEYYGEPTAKFEPLV